MVLHCNSCQFSKCVSCLDMSGHVNCLFAILSDMHLNLPQDGGEGEVDPFVTLTLDDPANPEDETHTSPIIMNENSPRWNIKYDFVMVSATSTLTAVVWDKQGFFNGIMSVPKLLLGTVCKSVLASHV